MFNGEAGIVTGITYSDDLDDHVIEVTMDDGSAVVYTRELWPELALAYAMTFHKSQGVGS